MSIFNLLISFLSVDEAAECVNPILLSMFLRNDVSGGPSWSFIFFLMRLSMTNGWEPLLTPVSINVFLLLYKSLDDEGHRERFVDHCMERGHFMLVGLVQTLRNRSLCRCGFPINVKEDLLLSFNIIIPKSKNGRFPSSSIVNLNFRYTLFRISSKSTTLSL